MPELITHITQQKNYVNHATEETKPKSACNLQGYYDTLI